MEANPNLKGRTILVVWAALVLIGFTAVLWSNVPMVRYTERLRAQDYRTYLAKADQAMKRDDMPAAEEFLERAAQLAPPEAPMPYKVAGDVYYHFKRWQDALDAYNEAMALGSPHEGARLNAVWALVSLERYREAVALGQKAVADGFRHPGLMRSIAEAHRRAGNHAASIAYYEKALEGFPDDLFLMEHLREAYLKVQNPEGVKTMQARIQRAQTAISIIPEETP